jgi:methyl-accepting chemotaxis protein
MALGRDDATRIVRFCLAGDGWGSAIYEDEACVLKMVLTGSDRAETCRFEARDFEGALQQAVAAGVLKAGCVDKQIAFLSRPSGAADSAKAKREPVMPAEMGLFPAVAALVSALVHETQRERGISSLYTASGGRLFGRELNEQWRATDRRREELGAFRERPGGRLPRGIERKLGDAGDLVDSVTASRQRVETLRTIPTEIIETYSQMNSEILRIVDDVAALVVEPVQRPAVLAWTALLHAKEKTGIERAQLASAFERDRYFDGQYQAVLGLIASRQSYLHLFTVAAPPPTGRLMRERLEAGIAGDVERMERIALSCRDGGFGVDPVAWFAAISRQVDLLGEVEASVRASLSLAR